MQRFLTAGLLVALCGSAALGHDPWIQTNTNVFRPADNIHLDLMLGNHGNDHRDFKLAGKMALDGATFDVIAPDGKRYDLKSQLIDTGYTPKEGFWTTRFAGEQPGLYLVAHMSDKVASYAPVRNVKGAKAFFLVSKSLDKVPAKTPGFDRVVGHPLELVPAANPVAPMGPEVPIKVTLLYKGKPLAGAKVSFIPRGTTLAEGFDAKFERKTNDRGDASFTPTEGNYYLVVAHREEPKETGKDYESTKYSATLAVFIPQVCPCCGE